MKTVCHHTGKVSFGSRRDAERALHTIRCSVQRKGPDGKRIKHRCKRPLQKRVYYCTHCERYHLTSWSWWFLGSAKYVTAHIVIKTNLKQRLSFIKTIH